MSQIIDETREETPVEGAPQTDLGTTAAEETTETRTVRRAEDLIAEAEEDRPLTKEEIMRPAFGALSTTLGAAFLVGGMFVGYAPRAYAIFGGIVGVFAAVFAAMPSKRPGVRQLIAFGGIIVAGLLGLTITGGIGDFPNSITEAVAEARLRRPPAVFDPGWGGIVPWTCALLGFSAAWIGSVGRKAAIGVLIPIPIIAFAAIAQPAELQIPSGIIAFATFVIGLAIIYRADRGEGDGVSIKYEIRRAIKTLPLLLVLSGALAGLSQAGFLFPDPVYDPTERAQKPKSIPLSEVEDRVLFSTETRKDAPFTGPWRQGVLDVVDGEGYWRLPPYNTQTLADAPADGVIGDDFGHARESEAFALVRVKGLGGTVLPLPALTQGIRVISGPPLQIDPRTQRVMVKEGQVRDNLEFETVFALLPTVEQLRIAPPVKDQEFFNDFTDTAGMEPPPSVLELFSEVRAKHDTLWDQLDAAREFYLDMITAAGPGLPSAVTSERIEDMFSGSQEATPYEIVATQAMMARWLGVPARIGYGFDGGEMGAVETDRDFRPKHGASWLEVYFENNGWLPVTGLPKKARTSLTGETSSDAVVLPGDDIAVNLYVPLRVPPDNFVLKQIQAGVLLALPFIILGLITYFTVPVVRKARRRGRRKDWALRTGRAERIAVAYADLRDMATDLGVGDPYATPLAFVDKVVHDEEHVELAWLVTRTLFGDLRHSISDDDVLAAEELSRSLRRRLFEAQPFTIRAVATVSRISLQNPYAPELLSPPIPKFEPGRILRRTLRLDKRKGPGRAYKVPSKRLRLPALPFKKKEVPDDVVA